MTTDSLSTGGDPRRLLSEVRSLAHRVRLDRRVTWVALAVLAAVSIVGVVADALFLRADCSPAAAAGGPCHLRGLSRPFYWLPALLLAYTAIAVYALRLARARGLSARVVPYVLTGVSLALVSGAVWLAWTLYWRSHPVPLDPAQAAPPPEWTLVLDRLISPAGTIGLALLVLAWLERHVALLVFVLGYLVVVLVPITFGFRPPFGFPTSTLAPEFVNAAVLLVGAIGFAVIQRRRR